MGKAGREAARLEREHIRKKKLLQNITIISVVIVTIIAAIVTTVVSNWSNSPPKSMRISRNKDGNDPYETHSVTA